MTALASPANASGEQSGVCVVAVEDVVVVDEAGAVVGTPVAGTTVGAEGVGALVGGGATVVEAAVAVVDTPGVVDDTEDTVIEASSPQDAATTSTAAEATTVR
jgi:hypothetical protein